MVSIQSYWVNILRNQGKKTRQANHDCYHRKMGGISWPITGTGLSPLLMHPFSNAAIPKSQLYYNMCSFYTEEMQ